MSSASHRAQCVRCFRVHTPLFDGPHFVPLIIGASPRPPLLQHAVSWHGDPDAPCTIYLYDRGLRGLASRCRVYARGLRPVADRRVANRRDTNGASVYDAKGNYRDEEHHGLHRVLVALRLRGPWQGAMGPTDERTHVPASAAGIPSGRDGREGVIRIGRAFGPDVPTPAPDPERRVRLRWQPAKGTAP